MTRTLLLLAFALALALPATAQVTGTPYEPDTTGMAEQQRLSDARRDFHVITVRREGSGFVYDVDGSDEDEIVIDDSGFLIVRAPDLGRVLFVLEPGRFPARYPNAVSLTPSAPVARIGSAPTGLDSPGRRVRALVCTSEGPGDVCNTWTDARPLSGGDGLRVRVQFSGYGAPDRNKARDDG